MGGERAEARPSPSARGTQCPVGDAAQLWTESSMLWCAGQFGSEPVDRGAVTPSRFLPVSYTATPEQIAALVDRVCELMFLDPADIRLDMFDGTEEKKQAAIYHRRRAVGHFHLDKGRAVIALDTAEAADPGYLTAVIVHELCHVRLLAENRIKATRPDHERLTDLLAVYFGFGIFSANGAFQYARAARNWSVRSAGNLDERTLNAASANSGYSRLGYLTVPEFGYALACYCRLGGVAEPAWGHELNPSPRAQLDQGLAFIAGLGPGRSLPTQRITSTTSKNRSITVRVAASPAQKSPFGFGLPAVNSSKQYPDAPKAR
jgi:hypothetical protein